LMSSAWPPSVRRVETTRPVTAHEHGLSSVVHRTADRCRQHDGLTAAVGESGGGDTKGSDMSDLAHQVANEAVHPFDRMVRALQVRGCLVRSVSPGSVRATCPTHRDGRPSLVVTRRSDRVLAKCFGGCRLEDIVSALGLRMADLFLGPRLPAQTSHVVDVYDYVDLLGVVVAQKVRWEPKAFRWRTPAPGTSHGYRWGVHGEARVGLYRWPDLVDATQVFVVEGEKSVELLFSQGFVATCPPSGASRWLEEWSMDLWHAGCREVVILPDNDRAGAQHGERIAASCYAVTDLRHRFADAGDRPWTGERDTNAWRIKVVRLPSLPNAGDVADWFAGGSRDELQVLVAEAPCWSPGARERARLDRKRTRTRERVRRHRQRKRSLASSLVIMA
jgi:hypothetical protein